MVEPAILPYRAYWLEDDEAAVIAEIQNDFYLKANEIAGPAPAPLRSAHKGWPVAFGGQFPAWVFYRMTTEGFSTISDAQEKMYAGRYIAQILVLDYTTADDTRSMREVADETTTAGMSAWLSALAADDRIGARSLGLVRGTVASGSHSDTNQPMFLDEVGSWLWARSMEIGVQF